MTVTDKWAGYLSRLDKKVHICMLITKRMFFLVKDKKCGTLSIYVLLRSCAKFQFFDFKNYKKAQLSGRGGLEVKP